MKGLTEGEGRTKEMSGRGGSIRSGAAKLGLCSSEVTNLGKPRGHRGISREWRGGGKIRDGLKAFPEDAPK